MREPHRAAPALSCLAPDIVGVILEGRANQALMLERLERPLPVSCEEQRRELAVGVAHRLRPLHG